MDGRRADAAGRPLPDQDRRAPSRATITELKYQGQRQHLEHLAAKRLELNEIGVCNLSLDRPIAFDPLPREPRHRRLHPDRPPTNATVGAGMLHFALRRAHNIHWQHVDVNKAARARASPEPPCVLWFTGLSGAGKSTIANLVESACWPMGHHTYLLDGDNVSPRPQPRPRLHRRRPGREHPPRRRGRRADGRCRPDRAHRLHLAVATLLESPAHELSGPRTPSDGRNLRHAGRSKDTHVVRALTHAFRHRVAVPRPFVHRHAAAVNRPPSTASSLGTQHRPASNRAWWHLRRLPRDRCRPLPRLRQRWIPASNRRRG